MIALFSQAVMQVVLCEFFSCYATLKLLSDNTRFVQMNRGRH